MSLKSGVPQILCCCSAALPGKGPRSVCSYGIVDVPRGHPEVLNHQWCPGFRHGKIHILRLCFYAFLPMLTEEHLVYAACAQNFNAYGVGYVPCAWQEVLSALEQ